MSYIWLFLISFSTLSSAVNSVDCMKNAFTQTDMNLCTHKSAKLVEDEMTRVYRAVLEEYKEDKAFIKRFKIAQTSWLKQRKLDFEAVFPDYLSNDYGSIFPTCTNLFYEQYTVPRVVFLKQWIKGTCYGEMCSGSIKQKYKFENRDDK